MNLYRKAFTYLSILGACFSAVSQGSFLPVCERTEAIKLNLEQSLNKPCGIITEADLLTVKRVAVARKSILQFKEKDLTGLKNLEILNIRSNPFTELPEGFFQDQGALRTLVIISTKLTRFPEDFLKDTPHMQKLHIFRNQVKHLSEANFRYFSEAEELAVIDIDGTLEPEDKARLEALFPSTGKVRLNFQ